MGLVANTVAAAAEGRLPADLHGLNKQMEALGWSPAGAIAPPYCRQWASGEIRAHLVDEDEAWFVDIIFRELRPEGVEESGNDAVEEEAKRQLPVYRAFLSDLLNALSGRVRFERATESRFDHMDFVESTEGEIAGRPFVMGVSAADIDLPVLVMARMGVSSGSDDEEETRS
ncbi:hypothetical protein [Streptomyces sp. AC04842]|nr:hypothetical protein [Streptomyces sp. AC04842]